MPTTVPVRKGLFSQDPPRLLGSRCRSCHNSHFPAAVVCPYCAQDDVEATELSAAGVLWAWTAVTAAPPGYRGEIPYGFGVVELPEGIRVISRLTESDPSQLRAGQPMRLVVVPLHVGDDGEQVVTYAFTPDSGAGSEESR